VPSNVGTMWRFLVKNWPKIIAAIGTLDLFLKNHPGIPAWFRERLDEIPKRIVAVQKRHGDAAKIRGMLDIIRDVAHQLDAHEGAQATTDAAASWIRRADDIELGVRLAESQARTEQKKTLARLRTETDALLAELIDAIARVRALPASEPPDDEPRSR
jgi:hypothetical protein